MKKVFDKKFNEVAVGKMFFAEWSDERYIKVCEQGAMPVIDKLFRPNARPVLMYDNDNTYQNAEEFR